MFNRDAEQAERWMAKREPLFREDVDVGLSLDAVEALIKKHEDFDKSLQAQVCHNDMNDDHAMSFYIIFVRS